MNLQKLQSHIDAHTYIEDINPLLKEDNSNVGMFFCADVVGGKRFAMNFGGYPRSEIAEINACADINQQANLLAQLADYSPSDNPNAGLTDAEIMLGHRSKYCQTASEQTRWLEDQLRQRDLKRQVAQMQSDDGSIKFDSNDDHHDE